MDDGKNLRALFLHQLKDTYFAENAILKALPKMAEAASSEELRGALSVHVEETREQVKRLLPDRPVPVAPVAAVGDIAWTTVSAEARVATGDGGVTLSELHAYTKRKVAAFVADKFNSATQTPSLLTALDQATPVLPAR